MYIYAKGYVEFRFLREPELCYTRLGTCTRLFVAGTCVYIIRAFSAVILYARVDVLSKKWFDVRFKF